MKQEAEEMQQVRPPVNNLKVRDCLEKKRPFRAKKPIPIKFWEGRRVLDQKENEKPLVVKKGF